MRTDILFLSASFVLLLLAATSLYGDGEKEVVEKVNSLISSTDPEKRIEGINLLEEVADQKRRAKLIFEFLPMEREERVRQACYSLLKKFTDEKVISGLCKTAQKIEDTDIRAQVTACLWDYNTSEAFEVLLKALKDIAWEVRLTVVGLFADAIERKNLDITKKVIEVLIENVAKEVDGRVQSEIECVLYKLTGKEYGTNTQAWKKWWEHAKEIYPGLPETAQEEEAKSRVEGKPDEPRTTVVDKPWKDPEVPRDPTKPPPRFFGHELKEGGGRVIFVIDISGSMNAQAGAGKTKLEIVKEEMENCLNGMDKNYWFNMVFFSVFSVVWRDKLQQATPENITAAIDFVKGRPAAGATNIAGALRKAAEDAHVKHIILLSDGLPTAGITNLDALLRDVQQWNKYKKIKIDTVGMEGADDDFMTRLATENGGSFRSAP